MADSQGTVMIKALSALAIAAWPWNLADGGDGRQFICAAVGPSVMADAYELFVTSQMTYTVKDMEGEVLMEYDFATRYYYMDL